MTSALRQLPITVVIPAFNREAFVGRAVASALAQRPVPPVEVLVVDDCSSDATAAAAEAAGARVLRLGRNRGRGGARNAGVDAAAGDWIALLDSDDEWRADHLQALWPQRDRAVLLAASVETSAAHRVEGNPRRSPRVLESPRDLLWPVNPIPTSTVLVRKRDVLAAGGFSAQLELCEDLDLWIRLLERGKGLVLPHLSATYHEHEGQVSQGRARMQVAELEVLEGYRGRPWYRDSLRHRLLVKSDWDTARAALATGERRLAARHLVRLLTVRRLFWLTSLWRCRWRMAHPQLAGLEWRSRRG